MNAIVIFSSHVGRITQPALPLVGETSIPLNGVRQPKLHRDVIAAFGRHPHRNEVLGRESTDEEREYLAKGNFPHQTDLKAMAQDLL